VPFVNGLVLIDAWVLESRVRCDNWRLSVEFLNTSQYFAASSTIYALTARGTMPTSSNTARIPQWPKQQFNPFCWSMNTYVWVFTLIIRVGISRREELFLSSMGDESRTPESKTGSAER
jgi:hypothetical protein